MARSYDDIVQELGQRYGRMDSSDPGEIENLQRQKDIFDAAIGKGFVLPSSGRARRHTTDDQAAKFLQDLGVFDEVNASSGVLGKAKKRGYTGTDAYGAIQFNDSFNAALRVAQSAGLNPREDMTFAELEALSGGANQSKFNDTSTSGDFSQGLPSEAESQSNGVEDVELVSKVTSEKKQKQQKVNLPTGLIQFQTPSGMVYGFYDGKKMRAATGQEATDAALGKAKYQTIKSKTDKPFEEFVPGGVITNPNPVMTPASNGAPKLQSNYTGPSVVDFLKSVGQPSDFSSRQKLAQSMGIQNYTGTADQNTSLLSMLRKGSETQTQAPAPAPTNTDSGTGGKTPQEMLGEYGITQDYSQAFKQNPVKSFQEIYQDVYKDLGISSVKREIERFTQDLQDFDDKQADLIQGINDDPWLTEGVRKNRIDSLETKNEMKRNNLLARLQLSQGLYDDARDEARFVTQGAATQYNREIDFQQDLFMHALDRAEQIEDNKAKLLEDNPADYKSVRGGLYNIKTNEWVVPPKEGSEDEVDEASPGFDDPDIESDVREDVVTLQDEISAGNMTASEAYRKLRTLYSRQEVTDQALRDLLGVIAPNQAKTKTSPSLSIGGSSLSDFLFK